MIILDMYALNSQQIEHSSLSWDFAKKFIQSFVPSIVFGSGDIMSEMPSECSYINEHINTSKVHYVQIDFPPSVAAIKNAMAPYMVAPSMFAVKGGITMRMCAGMNGTPIICRWRATKLIIPADTPLWMADDLPCIASMGHCRT
jgi:hypothetical protein